MATSSSARSSRSASAKDSPAFATRGSRCAPTRGEFVAFHAFHTVAKDELAKLRPRVGDRLGVAYHGPVEKGETKYELYRVKVIPTDATDPSRAEPDWQAIAADATAELERGQLELDEDAESATREDGCSQDDGSIPF